MRLSCRKAALLSIALALPLSACGSSQPSATQTSAATPSESAAAATEGASGASAPVSETTTAPAAPTQAKVDPIRGKGGLEERCLKEVARQGTTVIGTNRIEESQAAIEIYVNVAGGQAPWRCRANRDGTIESVEYTETEGAL